ncbi:interferon-inducible GTPase 5-like [Brienomyrus brachyistius]|uniref:interferon-inducible GTPase 5-like n=1 Tax=Brienomyrus brachyistius TaxID=42636 RepID=UPI0020B3385F|nr:interferon-inducible GTPase 5-like [Brienomyrus brachyistius]
MAEFNIRNEDMQSMKEILQNNSLADAAEKIQDHFNELDHVTLNIAVTGESGSGKSTFVNAFRGIGDCETNSAPTDVVETKTEPKSYSHPKYPNVQLWDLPGIGTPNFKADTYLQDVEFNRYDFFIIIASERFRSCNVQLAKEIQKMKKRFYFVRSKIDNDIRAEKRKQNFDYGKTLQKIRDDCIKGLQKEGITSPTVFLISSFELRSYDFALLEETMEKELPEHKRHLLLLSLPNITQEINKKKAAVLQADIWKMALLSGTIAAIPIPGLSFLVDVAILVKEISRYFMAFGLEDDSLRELSNRTKVPFGELKSVLKSPLKDEISVDVVRKMLTKAVGGGLMVTEYLVSNIPVFGSMVAGGISFGTTYYMLNSCLNELAKDSHNVLMRALQTSV